MTQEELEAENAKLKSALEACWQHVRRHNNAGSWWNDHVVWDLVKVHIEPALGRRLS